VWARLRFAARVLMSTLLMWSGAAVLAACPPVAADGKPLASGPLRMAWRVVGPAPDIVVGRHFEVELQLCPADARLTRVDASMPAHRHGMNYRPSVVNLGEGRYRAEGLMFHMAGDWELRFDVEVAGQRLSLSDGVALR
jgi:hypothetical protein